MKRFVATFAIVLVALASFVPAQTGKAVFTATSFGGVKPGMTVKKASTALGVLLVKDSGQEDCFYYRPKTGFRGIFFMVESGTIGRFETSQRWYATDLGARVGDTEARIKQLYKGRYKIEGHKYVEKGHYIIVNTPDKKNSIIFETDGRKVTTIRAGRYPEVEYVEGCS